MIACEDAWFSMPEVDVGLAGGGKAMMEHFSHSWARLIDFTARKVPAAELHRLGVISACVAREALMEEAMTIAHEIAAKNPRGIKAVKRGFQVAEGLLPRDAYCYEQTITHDLSATAETAEAQAAFVEKRKAEFPG